jgi:hypothetical protein
MDCSAEQRISVWSGKDGTRTQWLERGVELDKKGLCLWPLSLHLGLVCPHTFSIIASKISNCLGDQPVKSKI